jgi:hypothetical protein
MKQRKTAKRGGFSFFIAFSDRRFLENNSKKSI